MRVEGPAFKIPLAEGSELLTQRMPCLLYLLHPYILTPRPYTLPS